MFNTINLAGERVLVEGKDRRGVDGSIVLDAREWNAIKAERSLESLHEEFDAKVREFFAPLTEAADALVDKAKPKTDPLFFVVAQEAEQGQAAQAEVLHHLSHDSVVLRAIEEGIAQSRLVWVNGALEVLEAGSDVEFEPSEDDLAGI